jgi:CubicO group peptidase (beta-lactamase class C family)
MPPPEEQVHSSARRPITRRAFVTRAAMVAGGSSIAPFAFIPRATARSGLRRFVHEKMLESVTPGLAVVVVRGDEVIWSAGDGWANIERGIRATPHTVYMLASVSKTVTCAGIMALVEDGVLDLDADVNDYLPFEVHIPAAARRAVTLRMLLTHISSIRDRGGVWGTPYSNPTLYFHGDSPISLASFERSYLTPGAREYVEDKNFYVRPPGTRYAYSNIAVALAGYVAEAASGTDFDVLCRRRILDPLGMRDSGFRLADIGTRNLAMPYHANVQTRTFRPYFQYGYPDYPDGALRTSAMHLARWLGAFMRFGEFQSIRVLERSTVKEIREAQFRDVIPWHQGLIWYAGSGPGFFRMGHNGGDYGVTTRMFFRPDKQVGVISLTNSYLGRHRWARFRDIELRLFDEFS